MTSSTLFKVFAGLAVLFTTAFFWLWYATGEQPNPWLIRLALGSFVITLVMSVVNPDTRPRLMLRFLAALFALFTLIAFAADVSRAPVDGHGEGPISLLHHLQNLAPAFVAALERSVTRSIDPFFWDPVLTSILSLPATMIFLLLAIACGFLGRPRRRVRIFANDY
jgi:hypothetical protein